MLTKYDWELIESTINLSQDEREGLELLYSLKNNLDVSFAIKLQSIFIKVSKGRMIQLSNKAKLPQISQYHFKINNLHRAWGEMKQKYNCSLNEFNQAINFNKISQLIYDRNLKQKEIREMSNNFKYILKIYLSNISEESRKIENIENKKREENKNKQVESNLSVENTNKTTFINQLSKLQISSVEAVVHEKEFTPLQDYMHVEREIQNDLVQALTQTGKNEKPKLILLCGSVGDGKSHLLSYIQEKHSDLLENCLVHNDSTESFNPNEEDIDTLERVLEEFENFEEAQKTSVIAINLGVLHKFYVHQKEKGQFHTLCKYIEDSKVFSHQTPKYTVDNTFYMLNFAGLQPYEISETGVNSKFFKSIIQKVVNPNEDNPFYKAWKNEKDASITSAAHENYALLQDETIQDSIVQKLIEAMIQEKSFLSTRAFYNLIYDIIVPLNSDADLQPSNALPYMLFNRPDRSDLMEALHDIDPILERDEELDNIISSFILASGPLNYIKELLGDKLYLSSSWTNYTHRIEDDTDYLKLLVSSYALLHNIKQDEVYHAFLDLLFAFYTGNENKMSELFEMLDTIMEQWIGTPKNGYLYMDTNNAEYQIAVKFEGEPEVDEKLFGSKNASVIQHFIPEIKVGYQIKGESILVAIDYKLFKLLSKVADGYCPSQQDYTEALQFTDFYSKIIRESDQSKDLLIVHRDTEEVLKFTKPRFSKKDYEVEVY